MNGLHISEVAARSGFSAATLRYYEKIGLLSPPVRDTSGYRIYDERTVARLLFIGRAKQLGLDLDEVGELVRLWDEDECAVVQQRMSEFVTNKRSETATRIAELRALDAQLATMTTRLAAEESRAGPCDERCACNEVNEETESPPIVCTLDAGAVAPRVARWQAVLATAIDEREIAGGRRVEFAYDRALASELAMLVVSEQACCAFLGFTFEIAHDRIVLEVTAPEAATSVLDTLFAQRTSR